MGSVGLGHKNGPVDNSGRLSSEQYYCKRCSTARVPDINKPTPAITIVTRNYAAKLVRKYGKKSTSGAKFRLGSFVKVFPSEKLVESRSVDLFCLFI